MNRRLWPALLFALLLPLQSFAFMSACADHTAPAVEHCPEHAPAHGPGASPGHHCGDCCCMATAPAFGGAWHPDAASRTDLSLPAPRKAPPRSLDRLDRPPRLPPA